MHVVCKLLVVMSLFVAGQALASENTKVQSSGFDQTIDLLTNAGLHAQKAKRTSEKMGAVDDSLEIIEHTDKLIKAYETLAIKRLAIIKNSDSETSDIELAQESLKITLEKIISLRNNRTVLIGKLNSLVKLGANHTIFGSSSISFFEIPDSVSLAPSVEKLLVNQ